MTLQYVLKPLLFLSSAMSVDEYPKKHISRLRFPAASVPMTSLMYCRDQTITYAAKQSNRQKAISNTYTPQISKRAAVCSAHASSAVLSSLPLWLPVLPTPIMQRKWRRHGDRKLNPNLCVWYNLAIGHAFSSLPPKQDKIKKKDHLCV